MRRLALAIVLCALAAVAADAQPGTPIKSGQASFTLGETALLYTHATGTLNESYGSIVAMITFADPKRPDGDHLTVSVLAQKPGAVDLNQSTGNGVGYWKGGSIFQYTKGKSQCTLTVTTLTAARIEGTANCPVLNQLNGSATLALTSVTFSASVK